MGSLDDIKPMKKMEEEYTKKAFPEDSIQATFYGTSIYWRPQSEPAPDSDPSLPLEKVEATSGDAKPNSEDALVEKLAATRIT
jgi:hypothetical protein